MIIYLQTIEDPGDRAKFAELYERYRAYMLKIADEILKNPFDAEDALHNAFMKISEHLDKVADPASSTARGFVAIIVERKAIDIYRQRSRFVSLETIENEIGISIPPPEEDDLARCLSKLPPRYRHVIMLKYYHGYTINEIADMFGMKVPAVRKLDQRAKAKLEEICRKEGVYDL